jgi:8-oxo-dGTP pyrophosphatase MutT (NUDIX family)
MQQWKTRSRRQVLDYGKWLKVEVHEVELPDGRIIPDWTWIITPDYINVVAVTESGDFLFFRQTKYALDSISLAPVGGYIEPDEAPLPAAQRELLEETGYAAPDWLCLGQYRADASRGGCMANLYLAQGAHYVTERHADDLEEQELVILSRAEVEQALMNGDFKVLAWAANVALALLHLKA